MFLETFCKLAIIIITYNLDFYLPFSHVKSVGVLLSSILIKFEPSAKWIDPACTILFSIIIFCTTIRILLDTVEVLMEATPKNHSYDNIFEDLANLKHVEHVHDLRLWYIFHS